jgi:hypothetical protein
MRNAHVHVLAFGLALTLVLSLQAARSQAPVKNFELRPGVVVSLDKNEAYMMKPEGASPPSVLRKAMSFGVQRTQPSRSPCRAIC